MTDIRTPDTWMIGPVTSTAYGWRLERRDGVTLGFTSHDNDIELDGLLYSARPGMEPSSILHSVGLDTDGMEISGSLASDAIRTDDLRNGRWDNASLMVFQFDWSNPMAGKRVLAMGSLGEISYSQLGFTAELNGPASALNRAVVPTTSPTCRARFCGSACGLNQRRYTHYTNVASVQGDQVTLSSAIPTANFQFGSLRWLDGAACGISSAIIAQNGAQLTLSQPLLTPILAGARVALYEGCDKTIATCAARFGNAINFRGEPFLPGNDVLTRYPGAS
jgi:uncharacterized phage protein (TIGR02218 family)